MKAKALPLLFLVFVCFISSESRCETITFSWSDNSDNEDGFILEKSMGSHPFMELIKLDSNTEEVDIDLNRVRPLRFRVKAFNIYGDSDYSNTVRLERSRASTRMKDTNPNKKAKAGDQSKRVFMVGR